MAANTMSINDLLAAANMIEAAAAASGVPTPTKPEEQLPEMNKKIGGGKMRASSKRGSNDSHTRAAHNELEKTRRANLRGCLDHLKDLVPSTQDSARNTTLALLTRARLYIRSLEERNKAVLADKERLEEQQRLLRRHLQLLQQGAVPRPASTSTISAVDEDEQRLSPISYLEYSPGAKPDHPSPPPLPLSGALRGLDPYLEGLLPALPLFYPPLSNYPYLDLKSLLRGSSLPPTIL